MLVVVVTLVSESEGVREMGSPTVLDDCRVMPVTSSVATRTGSLNVKRRTSFSRSSVKDCKTGPTVSLTKTPAGTAKPFSIGSTERALNAMSMITLDVIDMKVSFTEVAKLAARNALASSRLKAITILSLIHI